MKKNYLKVPLLILFFLTLIKPIKAQAPFTIGAPGYDYTLTCSNSPISMIANAGNAPFSYTWSCAGNTLTGNYANISQPGVWTVVGQNTVTLSSSSQTFLISQNLTSPTVVVTPTVQNITCNGAAPCFTATSNLGSNVTTNWYQTASNNTVYVGVAGGTLNIFCPMTPGIYWFESVNNITGCASTKSLNVTSSVGVPIFSVTSPSNFTIGCSTTSITSVQVSAVITSPVPNVPVNFAFVPPPGTTTPVYSAFSGQSSINSSGTWVIYVKDLTNNCVSSQSVSIIQNTAQPNTYYINPVNILTCYEPTMVLTGLSNNINTTITWTAPAIPVPSVNITPNILVSINPAVPNTTNNLTAIGIFTIGAMDNNNKCVSIETVQINQDIRLPKFIIATLSTNSIITCINNTVVIVPVMTPTLAVALVPTFTWYPPIGSGVPASQYSAFSGGTHSAVAMAGVNGCTYMATYDVATEYVLSISDQTIVAACPADSIFISTAYQSGTVGLTFAWSGPPAAIISPTNQSSIIANVVGVYLCLVTDTADGCSKTFTFTAVCNTGLQELKKQSQNLRVYPQPATDELNLHFEIIEAREFNVIKIYNTIGQLIREEEIVFKDRNTIIITSDLTEGVYVLKLTDKNKFEIIKRFVIAR